MTTASVMIYFNDGMFGMLRGLAKLGVTPDSNSIHYCDKRDKIRLYQMNR